MQITREDLNPCTVKLDITCDPDQVKQGFEKAFKQLSKSVRLPGFRPGHAPRAMVEPLIAPNRLYDEAIEHVVNAAYKQAVEQEKLQPYGSPAVEVKELNHETSACSFVLKVPLKPVVELGEYKGLQVETVPIEVSDEEIDQQIENMRREKSTREPILDRGVGEGDVAVLNIRVDGEQGDGRNFMTIAGQTFPQLDQAILGMKAEDMKHAELAFPDNFQEKDWAGKTFPATITLRSVSAMKLPEVDDSFAKTFSTESVEELRTRLRGAMSKFKEARVQEYMNEQLLEKLLAGSTVHVPDTMWEGVAAQRFRDIAEELRGKNQTLEQYAKENGMTVEEFAKALGNEAATQVKRAVVVQEIAIKEQLSLSNQDLNDELIQMAREREEKPEDTLAILKKHEALSELQHRALFRKVTQFLCDHANTQEVAIA